jgi:hypothetical protein
VVLPDGADGADGADWAPVAPAPELPAPVVPVFAGFISPSSWVMRLSSAGAKEQNGGAVEEEAPEAAGVAGGVELVPGDGLEVPEVPLAGDGFTVLVVELGAGVALGLDGAVGAGAELCGCAGVVPVPLGVPWLVPESSASLSLVHWDWAGVVPLLLDEDELLLLLDALWLVPESSASLSLAVVLWDEAGAVPVPPDVL